MFRIVKSLFRRVPAHQSELAALPIIALTRAVRSGTARRTYSSSYAPDTSTRMAARLKLQRILEKA